MRPLAPLLCFLSIAALAACGDAVAARPRPGLRLRDSVASHPAELRGAVAVDGRRAAGARMLVLPAGERDPERAFGTAFADATGRFEFGELPPGACDLYAFDGERTAVAYDLELVAGRARTVTLVLR